MQAGTFSSSPSRKRNTGRHRPVERLVGYFHDEKGPPSTTRVLGVPLKVQLLTKARSFGVKRATPSPDDWEPRASFSAAVTFDTEGEEIPSYDPTGRVQPGPEEELERAPATSNVEAAPPREATEREDWAHHDPAPSPPSGTAPSTEEPSQDGPRAQPSQEELSKDELTRIDAEDDDRDFLQRLQAVAGGSPSPKTAEPTPAAKASTARAPAVGSSRHALFDELTPLLHRAQTYDLGTHRIDRRRLDALAASILAEEERGTQQPLEERAAAPEPVDGPEDLEDSAPDSEELIPEELDLQGDELRAALAEVGQGGSTPPPPPAAKTPSSPKPEEAALVEESKP